MGDRLIRAESPTEYFKDLVETAIRRQQVDATEMAACYVVNLLAGFVHVDKVVDAGPLGGQPLALSLIRALESEGAEQRIRLRALGDVSLFVSGFFSERLKREVVDLDYYAALGGRAYAALARGAFHPSSSAVFAELAEKFVPFVDVLSEVSEQTTPRYVPDLLRLYERWLRTGSRRDGERLVRQGIVPGRAAGGRLLQ